MSEQKPPPPLPKLPLKVSRSIDSTLPNYTRKRYHKPVTPTNNTSSQQSLQTGQNHQPPPSKSNLQLSRVRSLDGSVQRVQLKLPLPNEDLQKPPLSTSAAQGRPKADANCKLSMNTNADLNLKELLRDHSKSFPLKVQVVKGDRRSVQKGDVFNIHFVKKTKVGRHVVISRIIGH